MTLDAIIILHISNVFSISEWEMLQLNAVCEIEFDAITQGIAHDFLLWGNFIHSWTEFNHPYIIAQVIITLGHLNVNGVTETCLIK